MTLLKKKNNSKILYILYSVINENKEKYSKLFFTVTQRFIGHSGNNELPLSTWPPRFPELSPCDFIMWGSIKDLSYETPLQKPLKKLKSVSVLH